MPELQACYSSVVGDNMQPCEQHEGYPDGKRVLIDTVGEKHA